MFKSDSLAAKMSQLHSIQGGSVLVDPSKSIPKLQIAMLVVGTRGDVQPFLAVAKKLQACIYPLTFAHTSIFDLLFTK